MRFNQDAVVLHAFYLLGTKIMFLSCHLCRVHPYVAEKDRKQLQLRFSFSRGGVSSMARLERRCRPAFDSVQHIADSPSVVLRN